MQRDLVNRQAGPFPFGRPVTQDKNNRPSDGSIGKSNEPDYCQDGCHKPLNPLAF